MTVLTTDDPVALEKLKILTLVLPNKSRKTLKMIKIKNKDIYNIAKS